MENNFLIHSTDGSSYLMHKSHKYIDRKMVKGKWQYTYPTDVKDSIKNSINKGSTPNSGGYKGPSNIPSNNGVSTSKPSSNNTNDTRKSKSSIGKYVPITGVSGGPSDSNNTAKNQFYNNLEKNKIKPQPVVPNSSGYKGPSNIETEKKEQALKQENAVYDKYGPPDMDRFYESYTKEALNQMRKTGNMYGVLKSTQKTIEDAKKLYKDDPYRTYLMIKNIKDFASGTISSYDKTVNSRYSLDLIDYCKKEQDNIIKEITDKYGSFNEFSYYKRHNLNERDMYPAWYKNKFKLTNIDGKGRIDYSEFFNGKR